MKPSTQSQVAEVKIAEGVYFTDYRHSSQPSQSNNCLNSMLNQKVQNKGYVPHNNPEVLIADFKEFENKIKFLRYSIEEIKKEEGWTSDPDFSSAVLENLAVIPKVLSDQRLCVEALANLDPNNSLVKENPLGRFDLKIKETINELNETKDSMEKEAEAKGKSRDVPEGILL